MTLSLHFVRMVMFFAFIGMVLSAPDEESCRIDSKYISFYKDEVSHERIGPVQTKQLEETTVKHRSTNDYDAKRWKSWVLDGFNDCSQKCLNAKNVMDDYCVAFEYESMCYWTWDRFSGVYASYDRIGFIQCTQDTNSWSQDDLPKLPADYSLDRKRQTVTSTCRIYGSNNGQTNFYPWIQEQNTKASDYMTLALKLASPNDYLTDPPFYAKENLQDWWISSVGSVRNPRDCAGINLLSSSDVNSTESELDDLVNGCSSTEIQATMASLQMSKAFCDYNDDDCAISRLAIGKSSFSECYGVYSSELPYAQTEEETAFVNSGEMKLNLGPDAGDECKSGDFSVYSIGDCPDTFTCYESFAEKKCLYWENKNGHTEFETCSMLCDELDGCEFYLWGCHHSWSGNCQCMFVSKDAGASIFNGEGSENVLDMSAHLDMDDPHSSWFSKQISKPEADQEDIDAFDGCTPVMFYEFAVSFADTYEKCLNALQTAPDGSISDAEAECVYERLSTSDHICANVAEAISNEQAKIEQEMFESNLTPEQNEACGWSRFFMCRGYLVDTFEHCYEKDGLNGFSDCVLAQSIHNNCEQCTQIVAETTVDDKALKGAKDWIKNFVSKVKDINKCSIRGWVQCGSDLATIYETCRKEESRLDCMMNRTKNTQCAACVGLKSGGSAQKTLSSHPMNPHSGIAQGNYVGGLLPDFSCLTKLFDCATKIPQAIDQCGMNPACWATHALADATQCIPCVKDLLPLIELAEPQEQDNLEGFSLPLPWPLGPLPFPLFLQDRDFNGAIDLTKSVANNPHPGLHCTNEDAAYQNIVFRTDGQWSACMQTCDTDPLCQVVHMNFQETQKGWGCWLYKSVSDCESSSGGSDQFVFVKPGAKDHVLMLGSTAIEGNDDAVECSTTSTNSIGAFEISVLIFLVLITFLSGFSVATTMTNKRKLKATQKEVSMAHVIELQKPGAGVSKV